MRLEHIPLQTQTGRCRPPSSELPLGSCADAVRSDQCATSTSLLSSSVFSVPWPDKSTVPTQQMAIEFMCNPPLEYGRRGKTCKGGAKR